jgi:hypothetical protein
MSVRKETAGQLKSAAKPKEEVDVNATYEDARELQLAGQGPGIGTPKDPPPDHSTDAGREQGEDPRGC